MPTIGTMTDPSPVARESAEMQRAASDPTNSSSGRSTPTGFARRRRKPPTTQHTFHLNIGKVEVPRSLPPTRTLGTQTDESALSDKAKEDKKWYRRALIWGDKWAMPVLRATASVLGLILGRIGFGFRLN